MDEIDKELENSNQLTADRLQELGRSREGRGQKENLLSDDKLRSIMSFLDEVQVSDRLSAVDQVLVLNIKICFTNDCVFCFSSHLNPDIYKTL